MSPSQPIATPQSIIPDSGSPPTQSAWQSAFKNSSYETFSKITPPSSNRKNGKPLAHKYLFPTSIKECSKTLSGKCRLWFWPERGAVIA